MPDSVYDIAMNHKTLEAVFEQGVLRPLQHLDLPEHQRVNVTISDVTQATAVAVATCYELAERVGLIGALKDGPSDLSTNSEHFKGFAQ